MVSSCRERNNFTVYYLISLSTIDYSKFRYLVHQSKVNNYEKIIFYSCLLIKHTYLSNVASLKN